MNEGLQTRGTLLFRLRDSQDDGAWTEFVKIYTPIIHGFCKKRGMRFDDIRDVVQEVMKSVARAMRGFEYDPDRGTFRSWLFLAVRREMGRQFKRRSKMPLSVSETQLAQALEKASAAEDEEQDWDLEYRREMLGWAMDRVKPSISERNWSAFRLIVFEGQSRKEVAAELGMTENAVSLVKHRVLQRVRECINSVAAESWELELMEKRKKE